ncbi:uncharacterized protein LOC144243140 [Crocuta crocuta]
MEKGIPPQSRPKMLSKFWCPVCSELILQNFSKYDGVCEFPWTIAKPPGTFFPRSSAAAVRGCASPGTAATERFTKMKRNSFSPDYLDSRNGLSGTRLRSSSRPPRPGRGAVSKTRPVPRADLFGPRHTTIRNSNPAQIQQPIGQGAGALLPNAKGCLGIQPCSASRGAARPGRGPE